MTGAAIEARGIVKRYGHLTAVDGVSLEIREGEIFGLLGPNGAGKTTLMEIMEGLREPDAGEVKVFGYDSKRDFNRVMEILGIQLQSTSFIDLLTVEETIELFGSFYPKRRKVEELLRELSLTEKRKSWVKGLSGGQKQRLAIALALVHEPRAVFLDEPTTGLDPHVRRELWGVIRRMQERGITVLLSTHYMEEAEVLCDRVAIMDRGKIVALDTPANLVRRLGSEKAVEFNGGEEELNLAELERLEGVTAVKREGATYFLYTRNPGRTLQSLVNYAQDRGINLGDLKTRTATLEDVFIAVTGRRFDRED
ncbi:MAG: type transport system ATP-binding protein [Eubacteriales bacterium]|nr:type transport system ATP-binding protein [Eubacteriales bacterium]